MDAYNLIYKVSTMRASPSRMSQMFISCFTLMYIISNDTFWDDNMEPFHTMSRRSGTFYTLSRTSHTRRHSCSKLWIEECILRP